MVPSMWQIAESCLLILGNFCGFFGDPCGNLALHWFSVLEILFLAELLKLFTSFLLSMVDCQPHSIGVILPWQVASLSKERLFKIETIGDDRLVQGKTQHPCPTKFWKNKLLILLSLLVTMVYTSFYLHLGTLSASPKNFPSSSASLLEANVSVLSSGRYFLEAPFFLGIGGVTC